MIMEIKRDDYLNKLISHEGNHLIKIITEIRRCGKSYLLNKLFYNYLINKGIQKNNIIKFAFDFDEDIDKLDEYLIEMPTKIKDESNNLVVNSKKFRKYISSLIKNNNEKYYLLLDEVQLLENFVGTLNGYLNYDNLEIYVTGSNSKFLSNDIATEFRGRGDLIIIYPLSFNEYFNVFNDDKKERLIEYMKYGGLPLCLNYDDEESKQEYLINLYKTIYLRDLIERKKIKKIEEFNSLISVIASSIGSFTNPSKIQNTYKSNLKSEITIETIRKYLTYLEDAFLINKVSKYNVKGRKYIGSLEKFYFSDLGIRNALLGFRQLESTHLMENLIYNELINRGFLVDVGIVEKNIKSKEGTSQKIYYEVDFVANKGSKKFYIPSTYSFIESNEIKQELNSFKNLHDNFPKIIITFDDFVTYHQDENGYIIMNIFEFLLNKEYLN